jgi:hypothetical protein
VINRYTPVVTWGKIASWGVAAAVTAGFLPALSQAQAPVPVAAGDPAAGYAPITTGRGMCLDDEAGVGRDGHPVQLWKCLGHRSQAWRAEPDGTIRNVNGYCLGTGTAADGYAATANGARVVMVSCARSYPGSYWTISPFARQIVNKHAAAALDNRQDAQRDGNPVRLWDVAGDRPGAQAWTAVPAGGGSPAVIPGEPPALHVDHANMVTSAGRVFVPRGFTLSTLQYTRPYLDGAHAYSSVPSGERDAGNEPLPTRATVRFWRILRPYYGNDASVIIDVFNEPRPTGATSVEQYMTLWKYGGRYRGVTYLGHLELAKTLRADGYAANMLWAQAPGNDGLAGLTKTIAHVQSEAALRAIADPGKFLLDGLRDVSYSFHHPTVLGVPRTGANWDAQFGDLVRDDELSVNDGEWATRSEYTGFRAANGDSGPCWSDAPTAVPRYFGYLQLLGVGLTAWLGRQAS